MSEPTTRAGNRPPNAMRTVSFEPGIAPNAHGSVLVAFGNTRVICSAMIEEGVPRWMKDQDVSGGWLTAEYSMLPYSTPDRKPRDITRGKPDGRSVEIQRLIGRSLRAVVDLEALGPRTLWIDCDVLQADGGTRTASISGACVAVELAARALIAQGKLQKSPLRQLVAAVSVGIVGGRVLCDLDYDEDKNAEVDANLVMTEAMEFVELQASGEEAVFSDSQLAAMLECGRDGIREILSHQRRTLDKLELSPNANPVPNPVIPPDWVID
jgi:ribonuclease PH